MSRIIYEMTEKNLDQGLQGVPVGFYDTIFIDQKGEVFFRSVPLSDLVAHHLESFLFLMLEKRLPLEEEQRRFKMRLDENCLIDQLSFETLQSVKSVLDESQVQCFLLALLETTIKKDYRDSYFDFLAKIPHLLGLLTFQEEEFLPDPNLSYLENLHCALGGEKSDAKALDILKILVLSCSDFGGSNASAVSAKIVSASGASLYSALQSSSMVFYSDPEAQLYNYAFDAMVLDKKESLTREQLSKLFYSSKLERDDQRFSMIDELLTENFSEDPLLTDFLKWKQRLEDIAREKKEEKCHSSCSLALIAKTAFTIAGYSPRAFYPFLSLIQCIGVSAQVCYERLDANQGSGTPQFSPKYLYKP